MVSLISCCGRKHTSLPREREEDGGRVASSEAARNPILCRCGQSLVIQVALFSFPSLSCSHITHTHTRSEERVLYPFKVLCSQGNPSGRKIHRAMAALVVFVILALVIASTGQSISVEEEIQILLHWKRSLLQSNPSALATWKSSDRSPCEWEGIGCLARHVASINISNRALKGPIPDASGRFSKLPAIETLILAGNAFNGSVPITIADIGSLRTLDLSNNSLSGLLPLSIPPGLAILNISGNNLTGAIPPELLAQCELLEHLDLSNNELQGAIPRELGNCVALKSLRLASNALVGNIPAELGALAALTDLDLSSNHLEGSIPGSLFGERLRSLDLSLNNLTGEIPAQIRRSANLSTLVLSQNQFLLIPAEIGLLSALEILVLGRNNISELPDSIQNCANLRSLILNENKFSGRIPDAIAKLSSLQFLVLHSNRFSGEIPEWMTSAHQQLLHLDLSDNRLSGIVPDGFNASFTQLVCLLLAGNALQGSIPASLGEIPQLQFLDLSGNRLTGAIPAALGKLRKLLWLMLARNAISGAIPPELGNCSSLLWLNAEGNAITGVLPRELETMGNGVKATFDDNVANLPMIPKEIGECAVLRRWLPSNYPPFSLVEKVLDRDRCQVFWNLLLRGRFIYSVCSSIPTEKSMGYIQLSGNRISGSIPESFGRIDRLSLLFLYQNQLTGPIPGSLSNLKLTGLNLSHNELSGEIPASFGQFQCLQSLDLASNRLSGAIPPSLTAVTSLSRFNVSFNPMLTGPIPFAQQLATFDQDSYIGDFRLCFFRTATSTTIPASTIIPFCGDDGGDPRNATSRSGARAPPVHVSTILGISLACALGVIVIGLAGICWISRGPAAASPSAAMRCDLGGGGGAATGYPFKVMKSSSARFDGGAADDVSVSVFTMDLPKQLTYHDLVAATRNFHDSNIVGCGGFGVVYKACLSDGSTVAIKKLIREGPAAEREFQAEMHTLGHILHENLVTLMGYSSYGAQKLLVYEFMENGSLDDWLYGCPAGRAEGLDWPLRLDVAIGTARGLKFLHHSCSPAIIHRDMKGSNILLDACFRPRLTDFGLARALAAQEETHVSTIVAGTLGYVPPEYCQTWRATVKGDVYSYGVVLLELLSGRRPMLDVNYNLNGGRNPAEDHFGQCANLVEWAAECFRENRLSRLLDPIVVKTAARHDDLVEFLKLALDCTQDIPVKRPCMRDVVRRLENIKQA